MSEALKIIWDHIGRAPKYVVPAGSVVITVVGLIASVVTDTPRWVLVGLVVVFAVALCVIAWAQENRDSKIEIELTDLRAEHNVCVSRIASAVADAEASKDEQYGDYIEWLCKDRFAMLLHRIARCFGASKQTDRAAAISAARMAILCATAELVGSQIEGTRANIFTLRTADDGELELSPDGFYGRGDSSTRTLRKGTETFDRTMLGKARFVEKTDRRDIDTDAELAYDTYITYPIREGDGKVHGVLTVDCLHYGELVKARDMARMSVLAAMLAMTYRADDVRPSPRSS